MNSSRIAATPAARAALEAVRAREGGQVMFVQSGGCCAGSVPMCFREGEYLVGDFDVLLGHVDGSPCYIADSLDAALGRPSFTLDVSPGSPEGFSLGTVDGGHFVSRSASCSST